MFYGSNESGDLIALTKRELNIMFVRHGINNNNYIISSTNHLSRNISELSKDNVNFIVPIKQKKT